MIVDMVVILLLLVANGLFAMAEMATVSARKSRLENAAREGDRGASEALKLNQEPADFLAAVQIGITAIGVLAGAFGGATISEKLVVYIARVPGLGSHAHAVSMGLVVAVISYLSLVIGELVPKRLALANPERVASWCSRPMGWIAWLASPVVRVLSVSTDLLLKAMQMDTRDQTPITQEEIRLVVEQGTQSGQVDRVERSMIENVFRLGDDPVRMVMVPRPDVVWIDLDDAPERMVEKLIAGSHSSYPVGRGSLDDIQGVIHTKDLVKWALERERIDLVRLLHKPVIVVDSQRVLDVLQTLKASGASEALIVAEHSGFLGMVTARDILESLVSAGPDSAAHERAERRPDGSWSMDGRLGMEEFCGLVGVDEKECGGTFETLGGFVMMRLGHVPEMGNRFEWQGLHFEVLRMEGMRVEKVLVRKNMRIAVPTL